MKRIIEIAVWSMILLTACLFMSARAQVGKGFDPVKGEVTITPDGFVGLDAVYAKKPLKFIGIYDKEKPFTVIASTGKMIRVSVKSKQEIFDPIYDEGREQVGEKPTGQYYENIYDCIAMKMLEEKTVLTLPKETVSINTKDIIRVHVIEEWYGRKSPVGYYVNATGSDQAAGTIAAPWRTCSRVNVTALAATDSVYFNGGDTFGIPQNDTTLVIPSSGSAGNQITFISYGTGRAIFEGSEWLRVFAQENGQTGGWFSVTSNVWGMLLGTSVSDSIYAARFGVKKGIRVVTRTLGTARGNFYLDTETGTEPDTLYMYSETTADTIDVRAFRSAAIAGNSQTYITLSNLYLKHGVGFTGSSDGNVRGSTGWIMSRCRSDSGLGINVGTYANGASGIPKITYSVFVDNETGVRLGTVIQNCTFIGGDVGIMRNNITGMSIKNNLFYGVTSSFQNYGYSPAPYTPLVQPDSLKNNSYYHTSYTNHWVSKAGNYFSTLATWADSSGEINSLIGWQKFIGQADSTSTITAFTLQASSCAINAGVDVGLTTDYNGNPIVGLPDIGAFEDQTLVATDSRKVHPPIILQKGRMPSAFEQGRPKPEIRYGL